MHANKREAPNYAEALPCIGDAIIRNQMRGPCAWYQTEPDGLLNLTQFRIARKSLNS